MLKASYIITLLSGIGIFNSCTGNFINMPEYQQEHAYLLQKDTAYGNYLAGRVAHIRQDYDNAARYYVRTIEKGMVNEDLLGKTYIILASQGKIDQAVKYAGIARKNGDKNNFIDVINAVYAFKHGDYKSSRVALNSINQKTNCSVVQRMELCRRRQLRTGCNRAAETVRHGRNENSL